MDEKNIIANPELLLPQASSDEKENHMRAAIELAIEAWHDDEVPVGAVVVHQGQIIGRGKNHKEKNNDPMGHAEIMAIREASKHLNAWRLAETELYVTLEPCTMCSGAIIHARIPKLFWGTHDPKTGACHSLYNLLSDNRLNHQVELHHGLHQEACSMLLKAFFKAKRLSSK